MKIVDYTVGTPLPKPSYDQTDPRKGDYIKGDRSFTYMDESLAESGRPADAKATGDAISNLQLNIDMKLDEKADLQDIQDLNDKIDNHEHSAQYYEKPEIDSKLDAKANSSEVPTALSDLTDDATHRLVTDSEKAAWNNKSDFSGSYNDLTDKPSIPSIEGLATSQYVNDQLASINGELDNKADAVHNHNDLYYGKSEVDTKLSGKADADHDHNNHYYTKAEFDSISLITTDEIDAICSATTNVNVVTLSEGVF